MRDPFGECSRSLQRLVERRIRQLEIERVALAKETDAPSAERLAALEVELANLDEQITGMKAQCDSYSAPSLIQRAMVWMSAVLSLGNLDFGGGISSSTSCEIIRW